MHATTGWRRCIGCLTLQVTFRKRATNYRALLREVTYKDKASYMYTFMWHNYTFMWQNYTLYNEWLFCGKRPVKIRHPICIHLRDITIHSCHMPLHSCDITVSCKFAVKKQMRQLTITKKIRYLTMAGSCETWPTHMFICNTYEHLYVWHIHMLQIW